jgi:hypothetical protein
MKKRKKNKREIKIILSNRWLYTLIALGVLAVIAVGVWAYGTSNPSVFGHSIGELELCAEGQTIKVVNGTWTCVDMFVGEAETDPTVKDWAKTDDPTVPGKLQASILRPTSYATSGNSCSSSQIGEIRRCGVSSSFEFLCVCVKSLTETKWRILSVT